MGVFQVREEEKNQRQDLFILATSYSGQLKAKSASMIRENDFHQVGDKVTLCVTHSLMELRPS
jgi:THO complex subunit 2